MSPIGFEYEWLLHDLSEGNRARELLQWAATTTELHEFVPDFHRLQVEWWIWDHREQLAAGRTLDIGVQNPRRWIGPRYETVGLHGEDVRGNICQMPYLYDEIDAIVCTEVLEHCVDPFTAVKEMHRVLKPGGLLLVTSPFLWPWHGTEEYEDYWRFTHQGWQQLLGAFSKVKITECKWTPEGSALYALLRRFEGFGFDALTRGATGYLCEARK